MKIDKDKLKRQLALVIGIAILTICFLLENHILKVDFIHREESKYQKNEKFANINVADIKQYVTAREMIMSNHQLLIGKNKKELQNNYFDIAIDYQNAIIYLTLNKLNKQDKPENSLLADPLYIKEICYLINYLFPLNLQEKELCNLSDKICYWYLQLRQDQSLDFPSKIEEEYRDRISNYPIKIKKNQNMLNMEICLKEVSCE